jgi:hypothetical protein
VSFGPRALNIAGPSRDDLQKMARDTRGPHSILGRQESLPVGPSRRGAGASRTRRLD